MNKKKLITNIVKSHQAYSPNVIADEVLKALEENEIIYNKINSLKKSRAELKRVYEEEIKLNDYDISKIQATCNHLDTSYYPDPSGNNDSSTECNICGKEV